MAVFRIAKTRAACLSALEKFSLAAYPAWATKSAPVRHFSGNQHVAVVLHQKRQLAADVFHLPLIFPHND